jgi:hypothetical protein
VRVSAYLVFPAGAWLPRVQRGDAGYRSVGRRRREPAARFLVILAERQPVTTATATGTPL